MLSRLSHLSQADSNDRSDEVSYCKLFKNISGYHIDQAEFRKGKAELHQSHIAVLFSSLSARSSC